MTMAQPQRSRFPSSWRTWRCSAVRRAAQLAALAVSLTCVACGDGFEPASKLESLRVLAVKKSAPYAKPGEEVSLKMLWHDGSRDAPRSVQIGWLSACFNPPADSFELCLSDPLFQNDAEDIDLDQIGFDSGENLDAFSFTMPDDVISSRPPPKDPNLPAFGTAFIFFSLCTGEFEASDSGEGVPLTCVRDGETLGADDFVIGYTQVFAYDELTNGNPIITGFELGGQRVTVDCLGGDCETPDLAELHDDAEARDCIDGDPIVDACEDIDDCSGTSIRPLLDEGDNVESDGVLSAVRGQDINEQMWINYYADRGEFKSQIRLLNDAQTGWNDDYGTRFRPPEEPGLAYIWAVAHDNRGGTDWARLRVCVEAP